MKQALFSGSLMNGRRLLLLLGGLGVLLFAGPLPVWAHSVTIDQPFLFSGTGYDNYQSVVH